MIAEVYRWIVEFDCLDMGPVTIEFELDQQYGLENVIYELKRKFIITNMESFKVISCKLVGHTNFKHTYYDVDPKDVEVKMQGNQLTDDNTSVLFEKWRKEQ
jgi:hypothetical protein